MSELNPKFPHIRELREEANLNQSQSQIAKVLNVSQVAYSYYEIGRRNIPDDILIEIADFYDCDVDYLLSRSNIKNCHKLIEHL